MADSKLSSLTTTSSPSASDLFYIVSSSTSKAITFTDLTTAITAGISVPVKATGAEINTGTDDAKFATPKAIADSNLVMSGDLPTFPAGTIVGTSDSQTLTNKRRTFRVDSQTTTDTITPEIATYDIFIRTAQAHALVINNHSTSTPNDGDMMEFIITGDATPRAITYGDKYVAKSGVALPSTTVASKCTKLLFQWRSSLNVWDLLAAPQES